MDAIKKVIGYSNLYDFYDLKLLKNTSTIFKKKQRVQNRYLVISQKNASSNHA